MKKILFATFFFATAVMGLSSCMNGDYDANPATTNSGANPLNTGGSGSGGGGSNFSWTGIDPLSGKLDGTSYTGSSAIAGSSTVASISFDYVQAAFAGGIILIGFPKDAGAGTYSSNATGTAIHFSIMENAIQTGYVSDLFGGSGDIQILENDATHVKGKFFATLKSSGGATKNLSEGYFNVTK